MTAIAATPRPARGYTFTPVLAQRWGIRPTRPAWAPAGIGRTIRRNSKHARGGIRND